MSRRHSLTITLLLISICIAVVSVPASLRAQGGYYGQDYGASAETYAYVSPYNASFFLGPLINGSETMLEIGGRFAYLLGNMAALPGFVEGEMGIGMKSGNKLFRILLNYRYDIDMQQKWTPYIVSGFGFVSGDDATSLKFDLGGGLHYEFNDYLDFRAALNIMLGSGTVVALNGAVQYNF